MSIRVTVGRTAYRGLVLLAGWTALLLASLPEPGRPVLTASGAAAAACLLAAAGWWRVAGTVAVALVTLTVLLAAAVDDSSLRPVQVLAALVLLLVMVAALDRVEPGPAEPSVTMARGALASRGGPAALAVGSAALVAYTAARSVVPSVALVLVGLGAAVAALVLATRDHRG